MDTTTGRVLRLGILWAALVMSCGPGDLEFSVRFREVEGISKGAAVLFEGRSIGRVVGVAREDGSCLLAVDRVAAGQVTEHSRFLIVDQPGQPKVRAVEMVVTSPGGRPLERGALVEGSSGMAALGARMQQRLAVAAEALRRQLDSLAADIDSWAAGEEVRQMERELDRLLQEIERLGEEMQATVRDDILPRLRDEVAKLRRALERKGRGEDMEGIERRMRRIEGVLEV